MTFASGVATGAFGTIHLYAAAHERALTEQKAEIEATKKAEYDRAVKDTETRLAKNKQSEAAAAKIKRAVVRVPGTCNIGPDAMKRLNAPELIGP